MVKKGIEKKSKALTDPFHINNKSWLSKQTSRVCFLKVLSKSLRSEQLLELPGLATDCVLVNSRELSKIAT